MKVTRKVCEVIEAEAVQVLLTNAKKLMMMPLVEALFFDSKTCVIYLKNCELTVSYGDWAVCELDTESFTALTKKQFRELYREVE